MFLTPNPHLVPGCGGGGGVGVFVDSCIMENFVDAESKFSSHLTKSFLAPATARADL